MKFDHLFLFGTPEEYNAKRAAWAGMSEADRTFALGSQIRELGDKLDSLAAGQEIHGQGLNVIAQLVGYQSEQAAEGEASEAGTAHPEPSEEPEAPAVDLPYPGEPAPTEAAPVVEAPRNVGQKIPGVVN